MDYRPDVDGLRALAVLPVVLFHAGLAPFSGGFAGVNVFFVISGYLITSIIYPQLRDNRFSITTFYQKRADRLFPVLFVVLATVVVAGFVISPPSEYRDLLASVFAAATFTSNIFFWQTQDYFSASAFTLPLLHTWSLGVEEQFYILFPIFLLIACKLRQIRAALILALVTSFVLSVVFIQQSQSATFYLLPFRAWELLLGAAIALRVVPPIRSPRVATGAGLAGAGMLLVTYLFYSKSTPFPGHYALLPTVGAALIIMAGEHRCSPMNRLLSSPIFVITGKASYSIYMWHWPIIIFYGLLAGFPAQAAEKWLLCAVSLAAGFASWRLIEGSTRGKLSRISPRQTAMASAAMFVPIIAVAGFGVVSNGIPQRVSPAVLAAEQARNDYSPYRDQCHMNDETRVPYSETCVLGAKDVPPHTVLWGDSHGVEIAAALGDRLAEQGQSLRQITYSACPPAKGLEQPERRFCRQHNDEMLSAIVADVSVHNVILTSNYPTDTDTFPAFAEALTSTVETLASAGKHVVISYPIPHTVVDMPVILSRRLMLGEPDRSFQTVEQFQSRFRHAFKLVADLGQLESVSTVSSYELFCDEKCHLADQKGVFFFDRHHLSMYSANQLAPVFSNALRAGTPAATSAVSDQSAGQ